MAIGSTGFASAGGADCCVVAHPTKTTAAIVVSRRCFITFQIQRRLRYAQAFGFDNYNILKNKNIGITGGTGVLGKLLIDRLLRNGISISNYKKEK